MSNIPVLPAVFSFLGTVMAVILLLHHSSFLMSPFLASLPPPIFNEQTPGKVHQASLFPILPQGSQLLSLCMYSKIHTLRPQTLSS